MGRKGYQSLLKERRSLLDRFTAGLSAVATKYGERLLSCPRNTISFAITLEVTTSTPLPLDRLAACPSLRRLLSRTSPKPSPLHPILKPHPQALSQLDPSGGCPISFFGSMLFMRCVSGTRVVPLGSKKSVGPLAFEGYGAHTDAYAVPYLTAACALGVRAEEIEEFLQRLDKTMGQYQKRARLRPPPAPLEAASGGEGSKVEGSSEPVPGPEELEEAHAGRSI